MSLSLVRSSTWQVPRSDRKTDPGFECLIAHEDANAKKALASTAKLPSLRSEDLDAIFYTLGLGSDFDITRDHASMAWMEAMRCETKRDAMACRRPTALHLTNMPQVTGRTGICSRRSTARLKVVGGKSSPGPNLKLR